MKKNKTKIKMEKIRLAKAMKSKTQKKANVTESDPVNRESLESKETVKVTQDTDKSSSSSIIQSDTTHPSSSSRTVKRGPSNISSNQQDTSSSSLNKELDVSLTDKSDNESLFDPVHVYKRTIPSRKLRFRRKVKRKKVSVTKAVIKNKTGHSRYYCRFCDASHESRIRPKLELDSKYMNRLLHKYCELQNRKIRPKVDEFEYVCSKGWNKIYKLGYEVITIRHGPTKGKRIIKKRPKEICQKFQPVTIVAYPGLNLNPDFKLNEERTIRFQMSTVFQIDGNGGEIIFGDMEHIAQILSNGAVSMEAVDAYVFYLLRSVEYRPHSQDFKCISTRFCPVVFQWGKKQKLTVNDYNRKVYSELGVTDETMLIAPMFNTSHVYLTIFNMKEKIAYVYDSAWHYAKNDFYMSSEDQIRAYLSVIDPESKWKIDDQSKCKQQQTEKGCTPTVILYMKNFLLYGCNKEAEIANRFSGYTDAQFKKLEIEVRRKWAKDLLLTHDNGRKVFNLLCS